MLIIQRITVEWTKLSRGGDAATQRNAVPKAIALPQLACVSGKCFIHDVHFRESGGFRCSESLSESDIQRRVHLAPLFLDVKRDQVETRFIWSWHECGAPERVSGSMFRLSSGQWGRFICNGRFGAQTESGNEWRYHKTVFNVAFGESFPGDLFTNTKPTKTESRLAALR